MTVVVVDGRRPSTSRAAVRAPQLPAPPSAPMPLPREPDAARAAGRTVARSSPGGTVVDRACDGTGRGRIRGIRAALRAAGGVAAGASGACSVVATPGPGGRAAGCDVGIGRLDAGFGGVAADRAGRPAGRQRPIRAAGLPGSGSDRLAVRARRRCPAGDPAARRGRAAGCGRRIVAEGRRRRRLRCRHRRGLVPRARRRDGRGGGLRGRRGIRLRRGLRGRSRGRVGRADRDRSRVEVGQELPPVGRIERDVVRPDGQLRRPVHPDAALPVAVAAHGVGDAIDHDVHVIGRRAFVVVVHGPRR